MKPLISNLLKEPPQFDPHIVVRRSKRARRMSLRLDPQKRVFTLTVPSYTSLRHARDFAEQNRKWMRHHLSELPKAVRLKDGNVIPLFGRKILIDVRYDRTLRSTSIELKKTKIIVYTNLRDPSPRIARFLKKEAKEHFTRLAEKKARKIGKTIKSLQVRETKSRWGSCSHDKKLSFSWRLIFAPPAALDYVIAHEVAHLKHMNHGPRFWALCEDLSADFENGFAWMRKNGQELMRYG